MYRNYIFKIVYGVLRNQKDAEDAAQEVFIKIYKSLPNYKNQGFKTWVSRIAVNHAIDKKRKAARSREEPTDAVLDTVRSESYTDQQVIAKELKEKIHKKIKELPRNYREVIYGYYILEKSYEEMAKELNVQVKTIETKLYRARVWMRKHWKEEEFYEK